MADKPGVLRNVRVKRVALVDSGANYDHRTGDGAHIVLFKSAPGVGSVHVPTAGGGGSGSGSDEDYETDYEKANLNADSRSALPDSAFAAVWTDAQGKKRRKLPIHDAGHLAAARGRIGQAQLPPDVKAMAQRRIDAKTKKEKRHMKMAKFVANIAKVFSLPEADRQTELAKLVTLAKDDDGDADDYPMHKAEDPMCKCADCMSKSHAVVGKRFEEIEKSNAAIQKANEELRAQVEKSNTLLAVEITKRETGEVVEILKGFKHTPFDMEKDVPVYLAMKRNSPEAFETTMRVLKAQDAQLSDSIAWRDVGTRRGTGEGSAWSQIEAAADRIVEKAKDPLSREQAIEKAMEQNPKLVKQYRQEAQ